MRFARIGCAVGLAVSLLAAPAEAASDADAQQQLAKGDQARIAKQWKEAATAYKQAYKSADAKVRAEAAFKVAQTLRANMAEDPQAVDLQEAIDWYLIAIEQGQDADQKALAANNLGVLYTDHNRAADAIKAFRDWVFTDNPLNAKDLFVYRYNYARALERSDEEEDRQNAYELYWTALKQQPRFQPAAQSIASFLLNSKLNQTDQAVLLINFLLTYQQTSEAGRQLVRFLETWQRPMQVDSLLPVLLRYYEVGAPRPQDEQHIRRELLRKLSAQDRIKNLIEELQIVYQPQRLARKSAPLFLDKAEVWRSFPQWKTALSGERTSVAFARLLKQIGDYYYRTSFVLVRQAEAAKAHPGTMKRDAAAALEAVARYSAAFQLDQTNFEALLAAATVIGDRVSEIPAENRGAFVDRVFDAKQGALSRAKYEKDWINLYYMHRVLADFYARDGKLGPPTNPRTALFQLEQAKEDERSVRELNRHYPVSPDVYDHLGQFYKEWGDKSKSEANFLKAGELYRERAAKAAAIRDPSHAFDCYLRAAHSFQQANKSDQAKDLLKTAEKLQLDANLKLRPEQVHNHENIKKQASLPGHRQSPSGGRPVDRAREKANLEKSIKNLKGIALAMHNYENVHGRFPPAAITDKRGRKLLSWRVAILPFMEGNSLYQQFRLNEPWDSEHNKKLLEKMPNVYAPVNVATEPYTTFYQVFTGKGTVFDNPRGTPIKEITDGLPHTFLIVEAARAVPWTKPEDLPYDAHRPPPKLGGHFNEGFVAAFCDGFVRFISKRIEEKLLRALITRNGGETVGEIP